MATEGTTEREIGRIAGVMEALQDGMADIKTDMQRGFAEVKDQIAAQNRKMDEEVQRLDSENTQYRAATEREAKKDYAYLDEKIGKQDVRITAVEGWQASHDDRINTVKSTWISRRLEKLWDAIFNGVVIGILAFIAWALISYAKGL